MPRTKSSEIEGEVNRDNTKIVTKKFSSSIRTKTIVFFAIALLIPFICVVMCLIYYIPSLYSKYEDDLADSQVNAFLDSVQDGIRNVRVNTNLTQIIHLFASLSIHL